MSRSEATPEGGYTWTVTFNYNGGDLPKLTSSSFLTGNNQSIAVTSPTEGTGADEVQRVTVSAGDTVTEGEFRLSLALVSGATVSQSHTTSAIALNASAGDVQTAINGLPNVGFVEVSTLSAGMWDVTFITNGGDLP